MSATSQSSEPQQYRCATCNDLYDEDEKVEGSFCSERCYYRKQGDKALDRVRADHRVCASCGGWVKEIDRPSSDWEEKKGSKMEVALEHGAELRSADEPIRLAHSGNCTIVGTVLDATECTDAHTISGLIGYQHGTVEAESVVREREGPDQWTTLLEMRIGCQCGNTDLSTTDEALREAALPRSLSNHVFTFWRLERDGALPDRLDKDRFFSYYKETRDFEYALGRGLE